jgi:hypothetical protein
MQLVIDIDERLYEIITNPKKLPTMYHASRCADAVRNGTPLPKGHGDLIDKSAYRKEFLDSRDFEPMKILDFQPIIVKADKGE